MTTALETSVPVEASAVLVSRGASVVSVEVASVEADASAESVAVASEESVLSSVLSSELSLASAPSEISVVPSLPTQPQDDTSAVIPRGQVPAVHVLRDLASH